MMNSQQISPSRCTRSILRYESNFLITTFFKQSLLQVSCILQCEIEMAISKMNEVEKCIPWYFPPPNPDIRVCSPFEAINFKKEMDLIDDDDECKVASVICTG